LRKTGTAMSDSDDLGGWASAYELNRRTLLRCACGVPSDDQVAAYERFVGDLSRSELEGFFLLDSTALDLIARKRGAHNRLGAGLQIGTMRYLGHFLTEDALDVPWSAVEYVAGQLDIADPSVVKRYTERRQTAYEHSWEIRAAYGYRDFTEPGVRDALGGFMSARAWIHAEGAVALFEQARAWLRRERGRVGRRSGPARGCAWAPQRG
jgi:hypothetical protein